MTLIKCTECGNHASTKAKSPQQCGAKVKNKSDYLKTAGATFLIILLANAATTLAGGASNEHPIVIEEIPSVAFSIISESDLHNFKRSIDVRLREKISVDELTLIANKLKRSELKTYERTFICYFLPDMEVGLGAWAATHFNPELKVEILGLSKDEENALIQKQRVANQSRDIVGVWMDERPYVGALITIYREKDKLYRENKYKWGSKISYEMLESSSVIGTKLTRKDDNPYGEYLIIDDQNGMKGGDMDGIYAKFYPRCGFQNAKSKSTGINHAISASQRIEVKGSGESSELVAKRNEGRRWVMNNINMGTPWNPATWEERFGSLEEFPVTSINPNIIKHYYFSSIDMTVIVNVLKVEVVTWRIGKEGIYGE